MKVEYINPFIESVCDLFATMLGCQTECGNVGLAKGIEGPQEITALIGLSGPVRGTVAMLIPEKTALAMVSRLLGMEIDAVDDTVSDALGELVNIVAGGAKAKLHDEDGKPIDLSLPNVVRGPDHIVDYPLHSTWLNVPFTSDLGPFSLRVTFELESNGEE